MVNKIVVPVMPYIHSGHSHIRIKTYISLLIVMTILSIISLVIIYIKLKLKKNNNEFGRYYFDVKYIKYLGWAENIWLMSVVFCSVFMIGLLMIFYMVNFIQGLI